MVFGRMAPNITTLTVFMHPMSQELGWSRTLISGVVSGGGIGCNGSLVSCGLGH